MKYIKTFTDFKTLDLIGDSSEEPELMKAKVIAYEYMALTTYFMSNGVPIKDAIKKSTFPLEIDIEPCSNLSAINLKMRMGINASSKDPLGYEYIQYPERLTLKRL